MTSFTPNYGPNPRFLIRHLGNMGDLVFFIPPVLETLKRRYPTCHITFVTAWGFKDRRGRWGKRNQSGFSLHLLITDPHIDQLIHWHDTQLSLEGRICQEDGHTFPTWNRTYYQQQKESGLYDAVFELDFGLALDDNPIERMYETVGLSDEDFSNYRLYLSESDLAVAKHVIQHAPHPRIVLLEGLAGTTTRTWDPTKIPTLTTAIKKTYGVSPFWFGGNFTPDYKGRPLTLRENIATLTFCDAGIGVLSGPLHFAAAVGLPTITLYCDHPLHRAAPSFFLNQYITNPRQKHRTIVGPACEPMTLLKSPTAPSCLTPAERSSQKYHDWIQPGRQSTKSCLAPITADEVMAVLQDILAPA